MSINTHQKKPHKQFEHRTVRAHRITLQFIIAFIAPVVICFTGCGQSSHQELSAPHEISIASRSDTIRFIFGGDTSTGENYLEGRRYNVLEERGYQYSFTGLLPFLSSADGVFLNLETPVAQDIASPYEGSKSYIHYANPDSLLAMLQLIGARAVSLGNNHGFDLGLDGLKESLETLKSGGVVPLGAGLRGEEARRPLKVTCHFDDGEPVTLFLLAGYVRNKRYEYVYDFYADGEKAGVNGWSVREAVQQISGLRHKYPQAIIITFPHWGKNYADVTSQQRRMGRSMIAAGADVVVGHGPHLAQPFEVHQDGVILYSLGNMVFNSPGRYQKKEAYPYSMLLELEITRKQASRPGLRLYPIFSDNRRSNYRPRPLKSREMERFWQLIVEPGLKSSPGMSAERFQDPRGPGLALSIQD